MFAVLWDRGTRTAKTGIGGSILLDGETGIGVSRGGLRNGMNEKSNNGLMKRTTPWSIGRATCPLHNYDSAVRCRWTLN